MDTQLFRQTLDEMRQRKDPLSGQQARRELLLAQLKTAAGPEHVPEYFCKDSFSDYYRCSCGWTSNGYWDCEGGAWSEWIEHIKSELGLTPMKCPCGKSYTPADGQTACHEMTRIDQPR